MNIKELCKHENLYKLKGVATSRLFGALILINFSGYLNLQWIENSQVPRLSSQSLSLKRFKV